MATVKMNVAGLGSPIFLNYTNGGAAVSPAADGTLVVDSRDVPALLQAGASYVNATSRWQTISPAPRAGSAGQIVASTALANGSLTIAHQPDVPRQLAVKVAPGATLISAGNAALLYTANDGTAQTDNFSLIMASTTISTFTTSKGVLHLTSAIVTGLVGGTTPGVQIDDTNSLSLMVDAGFVDFAVLKENVDGADETIGTVASAAASIIPSTAPNGTHTFGFGYSYLMASS
jgi:hypothetical protein